MNHWSAYRKPLVVWNARPRLDYGNPRDLLDWTWSIIELGEECGVARFRTSSGDWWSRDALRDYLERGLREDGVVDAFDFSKRIGNVASRLAYFADGGVVEDWVVDPGALLRALTGATTDDTDAVRSTSPLWLGGHRFAFGEQGRGLRAANLPCARLDIKITCDIWLPWVRGWERPEDREIIYDNRELASRHMPRLNAFLAGVRKLTLGRQGKWEFLNYEGPNWLDRFLGPDGVTLDTDALTVDEAWGARRRVPDPTQD